MTHDKYYTTESIQVLKGLEGVRKRPGMYIGDTDSWGLYNMLWQLVEYVLDQHSAGYAGELKVELSDGWLTVRDDGPGIPTADLPGYDGRAHEHHEPTTALETVFLRLHCGRYYRNHYPPLQQSGGLHGVGLAVVNALSEQLHVETTDLGVRWTQTFERGTRATRMRRLGPTTLAGTMIRCRPDPTIFSSTALDYGRVHARLQELAWLHPHLRIWFQEQRVLARGGIRGWTYLLASERGEVVETFSLAQIRGDIRVDIAMSWNRVGPPLVRSFVNTHPTATGSHVDGFWVGFTEYARKIKSPARSVAHVREAIGCGLVAVVNVDMLDAQFTSQSRTHLQSRPAAHAVLAAVLAALNPKDWGTWRIRRFVDERLGIEPPHR